MKEEGENEETYHFALHVSMDLSVFKISPKFCNNV